MIFLSLVMTCAELIRAVRSSDPNLNDLLKTSQNQLESNCISRALVAAVHSGNCNNVGKLILRGAGNIEEALEESKKLQKHAVTATLLIIKAALINDIDLIKALYNEECSPKYRDLLGSHFEHVSDAARHAVQTVVPIEIARRTSATTVREALLLKTDIQMDKGVVSWHGLQLLKLEVEWLKKIKWVKILKLARNEFSVLPAEIGNYLKNCTILSLQWNKLKEIPSCLLQLPFIAELNLSNNMLTELPEVPEWPFSLTQFNVAHNKLNRLPKSTVALSIEKLNLSYNHFRSVPSCVCSFITLLMLDLSGNSKISSLPVELGRLKKMFDLKLEGLDDLNDPPKNVRLTTADCMRYLSSRLRGEQGYYRMKLMLVGKQLMGKSTIVARLQGHKIGNESTVGVDVSEWKFSPGYKKKEFTFSIWDFAGQEEYYATHQCFLSKRSLYLLCWNITEGDNGIANLKPWMNNISLRAPGSSIVVVATFLDKMSEEDRKCGLEKELCKKVYELAKQFPRLNISQSMAVGLQGKQENVTQLKEVIYKAASECTIGNQLVMGVKIPASYFILDTKLASLHEKVQAGKAEPIMHSGDFKEMVRSLKLVDLQDDDELKTVTYFLHEVGSLLHYDDRRHNLDDLYFIDPQWLCKLMSAVVTVEQKNPYLKHGILKTRNIPILFRNKLYPSRYIYQYLTLLHRFEIALPLDREHSRILVPSLLPDKQPNGVKEVLLGLQCYRRYVVFRYTTPPGLWGRLLSRIMNLIPEVRDYLEDLEPLIDDNVITSEVRPSKTSASVSEVPSKRLFSSIRKPVLKSDSVINANFENGVGDDDVFMVGNGVGKEMGDEIKLVYWRSGLIYKSATLQFRIESLASTDRKRQQKCGDGIVIECSMDVRGRNIFGQLLDTVEGLIYEWYPGLERNCESRVPCTECLKSDSDIVQEFQVEKLLPRILENRSVVTCCDNKGVKNHDVQLLNLVPELLFKDLHERFLLKPEEVEFSRSKESLLGEGGFGQIYRGTYRDQCVAVKLYSNQSNEKYGSWMKDLITESKILQQLHHPCLICMVGVCINPMALVLEVAPLGSLSSSLYKHHVVIPRIVIHRMAIQVVSALRFLHSIHIIFRDLKAANVLVWSLDPDHLINCKVSDFNTSTYIDPGGTRGFSGTKGFVAPEVAHVSKAKERSIYNHMADVFSFGMLLYQMIARQRPFHNLPSYSVQPAIEDGQRPGLDDCPAAKVGFFYLIHIMKKCWQGNPDDRPPTEKIVNWLCSACLQLTLTVVPFKNEGSIRNAFASAPLPSSDSKSCGCNFWIFFDNSKGTTLNILPVDTMTPSATLCMKDNQILCAQQYKDYMWVATRMGLECSNVTIFDHSNYQIVHRFTLEDTCVTCITFYDQFMCFGTMDGNCMLFQIDGDVKTIKSDSFVKLKCVSNHSVSAVVLADGNLWVSSRNQILLLNCEDLDTVGSVKPPDNINLPVGKLVPLDNGDKICSAFIGGYILSLWDVKARSHSNYVNVQQVAEDRYHVKDPVDAAVTAMNAALDTVWVGIGSGHILVFSSLGKLLTALRPYNDFVRFLVPLSVSDQRRCLMISGGKKFKPDESLCDLPNYLHEGECVDKAGVVVLWEVLPAKYLHHVEYLSSGKAWLNYSTLEEAAEDTGIVTQAKAEPFDTNAVDRSGERTHDGVTVCSSDFRTGCSLADLQTDFGYSAGSTISDESLLEDSSHHDLSEEPHTSSTSHSDASQPEEDDEHQKEAISFELPDKSTVLLSFQRPVTIKSLIIDVINSITDSQAVDVALYYSTSDDKGDLKQVKSQAELDEYLNVTNRPSLTVQTSN